MRVRWFLFLAGLLIAAAAACTSDPAGSPVPVQNVITPIPLQTETPGPGQPVGVFAGSVNIGPLCPIEPCFQVIGDTYSSRQLQLESASGGNILVQLRTDGTFLTFVPVGEYRVNLSGCDFPGCSGSLPITVVIMEGEATDVNIDIDTGIRSLVSPIPPSNDHTRLADDLRNAGADVEIGPSGGSSDFGVPIRVFTVNGAEVYVWAFPSEDEAEVGAATVSPDGFGVGRAFVSWTDSPHFYSTGRLIVLYIGNDVTMLTLLEHVIGSQFAGSASITPGQFDINGPASLTAHRELSARLGVAPEDLVLVHSRILEFNDGSLGCPDAGAFYTQALIPGYVLLYELNGVRYPFHVSVDGRLFTDCRGESNVAVPFRLADDIVTVGDAFQLAGAATPSHLGKEVVLRTRAEAEAYLAGSNGLVEIDLGQVDWETETLVGAVVTGAGCSFEVVTPLVIMRHPEKTVDVYVEADQTGLCEKAWAEPVWLVIHEIPKEYSASFILSYAVN
ncbi:MAG: hypothetical protein IH963_11810 [Chloroflexi bacterium]|nr:hypothetical protein [Chloroflexota bacterium]